MKDPKYSRNKNVVDILEIVNCIIENTKGKGEKSTVALIRN